jgi:superfamily I DNA and/or RNA helicase
MYSALNSIEGQKDPEIVEENNQSEASFETVETEHLDEMSIISDYLDISSVASTEEDVVYLPPEENCGLEGKFKSEVDDVKDMKEDSITVNYENINLASLPIAKKHYEDIVELTSTMKELITAEYALEAKNMEKLKITKKKIIEFEKEYDDNRKNIIGWSAKLVVPAEFIDKDSKGAYSKGHINEVDKAKIKVDGTKIEMICKILHIFPLTNSIEIFMELPKCEYESYKKMKCFKIAVSSNGNDNFQFTTKEISFIPSDILFRRRMKALRVMNQEVNSQPIMNLLLGGKPIPESGEACTSDLSDISLTKSQLEVVKQATTNHVSIIQGPPGTGKTHVISAIAYSILQQYPNERILLCGTSNQSVENMVSATAKLIEKLGKKFVWLGSQRTDFAIDENITEEQEYIMFNQMMNRDSIEGREFQDYQEESSRRILTKRELSRMSELRKMLEENISYESSVVSCTLETAGKRSLNRLKFSTVIIDEATQALEPSSFVPLMHHAERLILVGDQKQLGPIIPRDDSFSYVNYDVSLYERSVENQYPILFLDTQFRMHPDISKFSNECFYDNKIKNAVTKEQRELTTNVISDHVTFIETKGNEEKVGFSFKNKAEVTAVFQMVRKLVDSGVSMEEIGVISPYAPQVKELRKLISDQYQDVKIGSVDSFQGSQKNYIIISTVRSGCDLGFLKDMRRLNVAMTRARIAVIVIGKSRALANDPYWNKLVMYCNNVLGSYYQDINLMIKEANAHHKAISVQNSLNKKKETTHNEFPSLNISSPLLMKKTNWLKQEEPAPASAEKKSAKISKKAKVSPKD